MNKTIISFFFPIIVFGQNFTTISGAIEQSDFVDSLFSRNCPEYVDSCIYVCDDGSMNPCHPEGLYSIAVDTIDGSENSDGSRYRIYFPWTHEGMTANKFTVTASWPCLSPTAVYASGDYAYWDIYGNGDCPGTVQGSVWYGDDCQDDDGNIGSEDCQELVGRFCFVAGDTLSWSENADQRVSTDICDGCWMSAPAWSYYDSMLYADPLLSPGVCEMFDHCHHSNADDTPCGIGYMDGIDMSSTSTEDNNVILDNLMMINYPNPFNPSTEISYKLDYNSYVTISIYDVRGYHIRKLFNKNLSAGKYFVKWDGRDDRGEEVSAGMYIYSLQSNDRIQSKKMILLR